jgi:RNA polymerase sigma-70 factor, ECF subfamily
MNNKYRKYNDHELAKLLKSGKKESEAAFTELYNRYSPKVHAYCACMLQNREQALDAFQETFIKFYDNIRPERAITNVSGFLMTIARNHCLNIIRAQRKTVPIENMEFELTVSQGHEQKEIMEMIMRSLDLLDGIYKEAFVLREFDGLDYKNIAEICEISVSNAKSRVSRAREKLLGLLEPYLKDYI